MKYRNRLVTVKTLSSLLMAIGITTANASHPIGHPGPQPFHGPSQQLLSDDGNTTTVITREGQFPAQDPFANPPGSNHLETVFENIRDHLGNEMPNTLPSTPTNPYNLHDDPVVTTIDKTSPTDDLASILKTLTAQLNAENNDDDDDEDEDKNKRKRKHKDRKRIHLDNKLLQFAINILEGNPVANRVYSGFPLLHYNGPLKAKKVEPILDSDGKVIGGNVNIHQIWYGSHIESDTSCVDPSAVWDVPWTITYTIDTLNNGHEDFSPFVMYFQHPSHPTPNNLPIRLPHVAMDQTFFPMEDGTRTKFVMKMSKGMYYNLTYHWGWRQHPPRVQALENCIKKIANKSVPQWEIDVFGENPQANKAAKFAAISNIGDLSPAKRMWRAFRKMRALNKSKGKNNHKLRKQYREAERAFFQWKDRTALPDGIEIDPDSTVTLFYVNNTIYGRMTNLGPGKEDKNPDWSYPDNQAEIPGWTIRPFQLKVHLINGDYFQHHYRAVDFGGARGWENTFQSTMAIGGSGPLFTFGRVHWWGMAGAPIATNSNNEIVSGLISVSPAKRPRKGHGMLTKRHTLKKNVKLGEHNVHVTYNFEPSRRLRVYQFDPTHHDTSIWSMH